jgi:hypothetical protein
VPFSDHFVAEARVKSLKLLQRDPTEFSIVDASEKAETGKVPIKTADGIDQTELVQRCPRPASTADESMIVSSACG